MEQRYPGTINQAGLPGEAVQAVPVTDRAAVHALLKLDDYVDLIIPRGGKGLIRMIMENPTIPVIKHLDGVCHTYVDSGAQVEMALDICVNAKLNRPGTCNAMETMLVHQDMAGSISTSPQKHCLYPQCNRQTHCPHWS